ncbi:MAG: HAD-IA family hydrolase [Rhodospirillales bacterium]|nr:HAD-IA family hydrolase [Rhodospirillales bacterium]
MIPKGLLFDWDNTLVDSWGVIHAALEETFVAMGEKPWSLEECRERIRASARDAFPKLFGDRAEEASEIFYSSFRHNHIAALRPLEGAKALLDTLKSLNLKMGIVSNKLGDLLRDEVVALRWRPYFTAVIGAQDTAADKPASNAPAAALAEMGLAASQEIWFVGDTDIDMLCAVRVGCRPVLVRDEAPRKEEFADCRPHIHVESCEALRGLIRKMDAQSP